MIIQKSPEYSKETETPCLNIGYSTAKSTKWKNVTHRYIQQSTCQNSLPCIEGWTDNKSTIRSTTNF